MKLIHLSAIFRHSFSSVCFSRYPNAAPLLARKLWIHAAVSDRDWVNVYYSTFHTTSTQRTPPRFPEQDHYHNSSVSSSRNMSSSDLLNKPEDPVERTSSPYPDPSQLGPKSKILASRTSNYHSTSLRMVSSTNPSVNRTCECSKLQLNLLSPLKPSSSPPPICFPIQLCTIDSRLFSSSALHPGGVQPLVEHTELEEELHEKAHIDYERVAIVSNHKSSLDLYVVESYAYLHPFTGSQPERRRPLRRCPCLRDWLCHHFYRRSHSILWCEDGSVTFRQTNSQGARL